MKKGIIKFLIAIVISAAAAFWCTRYKGIMIIEAGGMRLTISLAFAFFILCWTSWLVYYFANIIYQKFINTLGKYLGFKIDIIEKIEKIMIALAVNDYRSANHNLKLLEKAPESWIIRHILSSEYAMLRSDWDAAQLSFAELAKEDSTKIIGLEGIVEVAMQEQDWSLAAAACQRVWDAGSGNRWLASVHAMALIQEGQWQNLLELLDNPTFINHFDSDGAKQLKLIAHYYILSQQSHEEQLTMLTQMYSIYMDLGPAFLPFDILIARIALKQKDYDKFKDISISAWNELGHSSIADLVMELSEHINQDELYAFVKDVVQNNPNDYESLLLMARVYMCTHRYEEAWEYISKAISFGNAFRAYVLAAEHQYKTGNNLNEIVRWMKLASSSSNDKQALCYSWDINNQQVLSGPFPVGFLLVCME